MALITCPECGQQISDRAKACPHCGCPVEATDSAKIPAAAPAPRAANPGEAILELPGPHYRMKTAEEWVVTDDAGATVKAHIKWGDTQKVELPLTAAEPVRVMPEEQLDNRWKENFRRKIWPFHKVLMIICLIIAAVGLIGVLATVLTRVDGWQDAIDYVPDEWEVEDYDPVDRFLPVDIWLAVIFFAAAIALVLVLLQLFMFLMHRKQSNATTQSGVLQKFYNFLESRFPTGLYPTAGKHKTWVKILVSGFPAVVLFVTMFAMITLIDEYYDCFGLHNNLSWETLVIPEVANVVLLPLLLLYGIFLAVYRWHYGRRSKHLHFIASPGKRYGLVWKNRHSFSVSEYNA